MDTNVSFYVISMNFLKITLGVEKYTYLKCGASYPVKKKKRKKTGQIVTQGEKN